MLVAGVYVRLRTDGHEPVEVVDVDVDEDAVEAGKDLLGDGGEVLGEGHLRRHGEYGLVVDLRLDPVHQQRDVLEK